MNDSLFIRFGIIEINPVFRSILIKGNYHLLRQFILKRPNPAVCRNNVVNDSKRTIRISDTKPAFPYHCEGLRRSYFMNKMQPDKELIQSRIQSFYPVEIPDFIEQVFSHITDLPAILSPVYQNRPRQGHPRMRSILHQAPLKFFLFE